MSDLEKSGVPSLPWVSVDDALPRNGQAVLVRRSRDNWGSKHSLADGSVHEIWRWQTAKFVLGRTKAELEAMSSPSIGSADEWGNNLKPYYWEKFGLGDLFGQDVSHWVAITDPLS